jgi:hypothetical protein
MNVYTTHMDKIKMDEYLNWLTAKVSQNFVIPKKTEKIIGDIIILPQFNEYYFMAKYGYNSKQLKQMAKEYGVKITGNKTQVATRIYSHLFLSQFAVKIQKIVRGHLFRKCIELRGPAFKNKTLCVNKFDFLSMDELTTIPAEQFFSFKDDDGIIYGFDLLSFYNLIFKYKTECVSKNPFNQQPFSRKVIKQFKVLLRISRILKVPISTELEDITKELSTKKSVELKALSLFQNIDALGNYSNAKWFLDLDKPRLINFIYELEDMWEYRAGLSKRKKRQICPFGNPFTRMPDFDQIDNLDELRGSILKILEHLVNTGISKDNKCLGAFYVLGALTLVNAEAARCLPWLLEAVYPM